MSDPPEADRRKEMRDIRDAIAEGRFADIPDALRSMKRLWPEGNGLRDRREREARLFEEGLQTAAAAHL
jgi:Arc/MetJ-type ribon-helix-helix transcriptional regulator